MASQPPSPFPGLRSFKPDEEHLFFGREKQTEDLLLRLRGTRFVTVVGASGSGKSSLVQSGLIPALHGGYMTSAGSSWRIAVMRPGSDPIGNLAEALYEPDVVGAGAGMADFGRPLVETTLRRSARGLSDSVRFGQLPSFENVLVVVDQFEELFRFKRIRGNADARDEAVAFVRLLLGAAEQKTPKVFVVLTMRSEFIGECTDFPGLAEAVNDGQYLVPRMTRDQLRLAITGPVAVVGADVAPRLVTRLLNDVGDDPDQLPILQHALMRTWNHWAGRQAGGDPIDLADYEAIGTMRSALSQHAEEAFGELATERDRTVAERVFKRLVELTPHAGGVRAPCRVVDLCAAADADLATVIGIVERFRVAERSFLTPPRPAPLTDATVIDLSHESFMRLWRRLTDWIQEEARAAEIYRRLSHAAAVHQHEEGGLWRDPELQFGLNWREAHKPTAGWAARYASNFDEAMAFLDRSVEARDLERAERVRARRRRFRFLAGAVATLTVFSAFAVASLIVALRERNEARNQTTRAEQQALRAQTAEQQADLARRAAEEARNVAESQAAIARAAAERAGRATLEAESAKGAADVQRGVAETARANADAERFNALAAQRAAEADRTRAVDAENSAVAERNRAETERGRAEDASRAAVNEQYRSLARALAQEALASAESARIRLLMAVQAYNFARDHGGEPHSGDITNALRVAVEGVAGNAGKIFLAHDDAVRASLLSPAGQLITGSDDGRVRSFDARDAARPATTIATLGSPVRALALNADATLLAAGTLDGRILVWNFPAGERAAPRKTFTGHPGNAVSGLAFAADGRLLSVGYDGRALAWRAGTFENEGPLSEPRARRLLGVAMSPDGGRFAASIGTGGILIVPLTAGASPLTIGADVDASSVTFSGDGRLLIAGTSTGELVSWAIPDLSRPASRTLAHGAAITALRAVGSKVVSASLDGNVKVWETGDAAGFAQGVVLAHGSWVWDLAITLGAERIFSAGADGRVRAWDIDADAIAVDACRLMDRNFSSEEWNRYVSSDVTYEGTCTSVSDGRQRVQLR